MKKRSTYAHTNGEVLDDDVLWDPAFADVLKKGSSYSKSIEVRNQDRAVSTRIAGSIARVYGDRGLAEKGGKVELNYKGSAGQSFGAFCISGMHLTLEG